MAKSKERESFESSQLERCANLVSFMTPEFVIFSIRATTPRVTFNIECLFFLLPSRIRKQMLNWRIDRLQLGLQFSKDLILLNYA